MNNNARKYDQDASIIEVRELRRKPRKRSLKKRLYNKFVRWYNNHIAIIVLVGLPLITAIAATLIATGIADYKNANAMRDYGRNKYYTVYDIQNGDTLWGIASDMTSINPEYPNIQKYIDEVLFINNMMDANNITSGDFLILPYYSNGKSTQDIIDTYDLN